MLGAAVVLVTLADDAKEDGKGWTEMVMDIMDSNKDGKISIMDFLDKRWEGKTAYPGKAEWTEFKEDYDKNSDGVITEDEG